jgi:hypothetical protein
MAKGNHMKKRNLMAGMALIVGLASCGSTPSVQAATPEQKLAATASITKITNKLQSFGLTAKSALAAQAATGSVSGSVTVPCDQGSITYTFSSDSSTGAGSTGSSGGMALKSASCTKGDVTISDMDLNLKFEGALTQSNAAFKFVYDGGLTFKDSTETTKIKFANLSYDVKVSSTTSGTSTTLTITSTINGTVTANDSFVTYSNESFNRDFTY